MKILFAASEAMPFIKIGGLGDVMGALPKTLVKKGIDARVILPLYSIIDGEKRNNIKFLESFGVKNSWRENHCGLFRAESEGVIYYFIDNEQYFGRENVYGEYDDPERFAFFSRAVLDSLPHIDFFPDVLHANDWHTALVPVYLNVLYRGDERYKHIKTVLSIHNIEFQGKYDPIILGSIFGMDVTVRSLLMYDGCLNLLKGGIECADMVTTVSRTYAEEILYPGHSHGLHNILNQRRGKIRGIINGIDTDLFNPEGDKFTAGQYNADNIRGKATAKKDLQRSMALDMRNDVPIIGMVTRLTPQKGLDLIGEVMEKIVDMDVQFVLLGTGYSEYEALMYGWEQARHDKVRSIIAFSNEMASKIYAGADIFLMPSLSEPCGLSQMIAMRYGAIPVVHTVGGLKDTVQPFNPETKEGTGITFQSYNAYDMLDAIYRAVDLYHNKNLWRRLIKNAMTQDFGWDKSADEYIKLYNTII
ncbi:MAG: glycogen synthase GlgA [Eubacteriales bacterium]|nr:glycogen synthase GlgA [Eubacteriales bacterium]